MSNHTPHFDALVIGAGFSGLYALHHLRDQLGLSVRAFDSAGGVGGTWWYNRYPGARVDAPSSPFYAYTFSKELVDDWTWHETQTSQADVLAYLEHVAQRCVARRHRRAVLREIDVFSEGEPGDALGRLGAAGA